MRLSSVLVLLVLAAASTALASPEVSDSDIIAAFLACPEIIAAQEYFGERVESDYPVVVFRQWQCR